MQHTVAEGWNTCEPGDVVAPGKLADAVKPVKEIVDEHRTQIRSSEGEWRRGSKMDIYV